MESALKTIREMPKIELHLHLEGAIPVELLFEFIKNKNPSEIRNLTELKEKMKFINFEHFIKTWIWQTKFINNESYFKDIAYYVLKNLSEQNVKYVEAFYSPFDFLKNGISVQGITENIIEGKEKAYQDFGVKCNLIADLVRDYGAETGKERLKLLTPYLGKGIIGIGIGGSEQMFPPAPYAKVYQEAKSLGFRLTAHAGEAAGAESVWSVIKDLGVERIGHGVRANEDPQLIEFLAVEQIPLEVCVTSNIKTGVYKSVHEHPIKDYFSKGLLVTINSDDPTMFNTSITEEFLLLYNELGFTIDELKELYFNSVDATFLPQEEKDSLKLLINT